MGAKTEQTAMASEIVTRISALIAEHGDTPIWFMDPMSGSPIPMDPSEISVAGDGHIEVWPKAD